MTNPTQPRRYLVAVQRTVTVVELVQVELTDQQLEAIGGGEIDSERHREDLVADQALEILKVRHKIGDQPEDYKERDAKEAALGSKGCRDIETLPEQSTSLSVVTVMDAATGQKIGG